MILLYKKCDSYYSAAIITITIMPWRKSSLVSITCIYFPNGTTQTRVDGVEKTWNCHERTPPLNSWDKRYSPCFPCFELLFHKHSWYLPSKCCCHNYSSSKGIQSKLIENSMPPLQPKFVSICFRGTSWNFIVLYSALYWLKLKMLKSIVSVLLCDWLTLSGWPQ